jgi:hypothetical protein
MATERFVGQHVSIGTASENGQRTKPSAPGVDVGQRSGGEDQMSIPPVKRNGDTSSEQTVPGSRRYGQ